MSNAGYGRDVANLQIWSMPEDLHATLARRARAERTSMSEYALRVLRRDLERPSLAEWFERHGETLPVGGGAEFDIEEALADTRPLAR
jgi:hypothetical protein